MAVILPAAAFCQRHSLAVITPEKNASSEELAAAVSVKMDKKFRLVDLSMADAAFRSAEISEPFNQTIETAQTLAETIGCEYFVLIRTGDHRRAGVDRPDYFESNAAVFIVSGRTGELRQFRLYVSEGKTEDAARSALKNSAAEIADEISRAVAGDKPDDTAKTSLPLPPDPASQTFRAPVPYKRMKPGYTEQAMIYGIEATVDVSVDIDAKGTVLRTDIRRWAGYGLDESVEENIRRMNWRPAELAGKYLPMRILLRYNFKDIQNPE
jgi:TonB family protein